MEKMLVLLLFTALYPDNTGVAMYAILAPINQNAVSSSPMAIDS